MLALPLELRELLDSHPVYDEALTHSSYGNESGSGRSYERLEFLGDAVLEMVISHWLYQRYPQGSEGEMTRLRAALVCEAALAEQARRLGLGAFLRLGKGEEAAGGRERPALLADAFESFLGALYLDRGLPAVTAFLTPWFEADLSGNSHRLVGWDPKGRLQEWAQAQGLGPVYRLEGTEGPDHRKVFRVAVYLGTEVAGRGEGRSKKEAEQEAALAALRRLEIAQQTKNTAD